METVAGRWRAQPEAPYGRGRDTAALLECIAKAKARCALAPEAGVGSCYEAGRDGFWLHRLLIARHRVAVPDPNRSLEFRKAALRFGRERRSASAAHGLQNVIFVVYDSNPS